MSDKKLTYIQKVRKLHNGRLPKSFKLYMHYGEFKKFETEEAAKSFFKTIMGFPDDKRKAKKLGLI